MAGDGGAEISLIEATAMVDGQSIDGQTVVVGHNEGVIRFEARLVDGRHEPAPGHTVRVAFDMPGRGMMMHHRGTFMLHDDGTHGDAVPHDGLYCFEDVTGEYGCHRPDAPPGEYHYDFCGVDADGRESNHLQFEVVLVQ